MKILKEMNEDNGINDLIATELNTQLEDSELSDVYDGDIDADSAVIAKMYDLTDDSSEDEVSAAVADWLRYYNIDKNESVNPHKEFTSFLKEEMENHKRIGFGANKISEVVKFMNFLDTLDFDEDEFEEYVKPCIDAVSALRQHMISNGVH